MMVHKFAQLKSLIILKDRGLLLNSFENMGFLEKPCRCIQVKQAYYSYWKNKVMELNGVGERFVEIMISFEMIQNKN